MRHFIYTLPGSEEEAAKRAVSECELGYRVLLVGHSGRMVTFGNLRPFLHSRTPFSWRVPLVSLSDSDYSNFDSIVHVSILMKKFDNQ